MRYAGMLMISSCYLINHKIVSEKGVIVLLLTAALRCIADCTRYLLQSGLGNSGLSVRNLCGNSAELIVLIIPDIPVMVHFNGNHIRVFFKRGKVLGFKTIQPVIFFGVNLQFNFSGYLTNKFSFRLNFKINHDE
jgi:hypothetical protein